MPKALNFAFSSPPEAIAAFWTLRLKRTAFFTDDALAADNAWGGLTPTNIRPSAGKLPTASLMHLMYQRSPGGSFWRQQFLFGSPLVGKMIRQHSAPSYANQSNLSPLKPSELAHTSATRFSERDRRSGQKPTNPSGAKLSAIKVGACYRPLHRR